MTVTGIEAITKTKFQVELDGEFAFVLYKGELKRFGIQENAEVSEEIYEKIRKEVILKRAKLRAVHLLTDMARTEKNLKEKLHQSLYPDDIVDAAIAYVHSFGYLDDGRYAENFVESRKNTKSRREIYAALLQRGVSAEQIEQAFENCYQESGEEEAIRKLAAKKHIDIHQTTEEDLYKFYGYLGRKGFRYEDIRKVFGARFKM